MKADKRSLALILALVLICTVLPVPAAQAADVQPVLSAALARQASAVPSPGYGDEWTVLGLARGGYFTADSDYFARYYADLAAKVPELTAASGRDGALNAYKSTDNSRVILALSAIGRDAAQVGGCDLTAPYADFAWVSNQGINGPIFALLALDSRNYLPGSAVRRQCVDAILSAECSGGGWAFGGSAADPDMTAMALQALAAYRSEAAVAAAVTRGLDVLSAMQTGDGGFASSGVVNAESAAQVIVACTALGIDPDTDSRFVKGGGSAVDALLTFFDAGAAAFRHTASGSVNSLATEQAVYALRAEQPLSGDGHAHGRDARRTRRVDRARALHGGRQRPHPDRIPHGRGVPAGCVGRQHRHVFRRDAAALQPRFVRAQRHADVGVALRAGRDG